MRPILLLGALLACSCGDNGTSSDGGADAPLSCASDGGDAGDDPCGDGMVCGPDGTCQASSCGDGILDPQNNGEECDDGNAIAFDGCEPGSCLFSCHTAADCDDGVLCNGDEACPATTHVCSRTTAPDNGTACDLTGTGDGVCREGTCVVPSCGDGMATGSESCDDGNITPSDGCENDCRFTCEVDPSMEHTWYADCDSDGYASSGLGVPTSTECLRPAPGGCGGTWTLTTPVAGASDCDDTMSAVRPGATELCDALDNDCNGAIDDNAMRTFFHDQDSDGFGNPAATMVACNMPVGYVENNMDCNDTCATCNPSATETCDLMDNDCDGTPDEGVQSTFYRDNDSDARGNPSMTMMACTAPLGYVADASDCNDTCASCYPGGSETCDGLDNDCDGTPDDAVGPTWYRDADNDTYGVSSNTTVACSQPGGYASRSGDCNDGNSFVNPGVSEICLNGTDDNCDGNQNESADCYITCNWGNEARWLSHGYDGGGALGTGMWVSCYSGRVSYMEWVMGAVATTPSTMGTGDVLVGCNYTGNRWASQGWDGGAAFTNGTEVACNGTRVTNLAWEVNGEAAAAARSGDLGCNWSGARWITHGADGGCAFSTGFGITCNAGRITHFQWIEGAGCGRARD